MNGEKASETLPVAICMNNKLDDDELTWKIPNQQLSDRNNDVSPISSRYSSCGESEFDKYCSANSVMGTPSLCGSVGTFQDFDSDFGSVKSPRVRDLESFSLGGKFERKFEGKSLLTLGKSGSKERNNGNLEQRLTHSYDEMEDLADEGGVIMWKDNVTSKRLPSTSTDVSVSEEPMKDHIGNVEVEEGVTIDQVNRDLDECSESEGSKSEGSMYGYGTDNEQHGGIGGGLSFNYYSQENKSKNENKLLMNSSVAYGADDWDDFTQETMEPPQDLFVIDEIQTHNHTEIGTSKFMGSTIDVLKKQEYVKDLHVDNEIDVDFDLQMYSKTRSVNNIDMLKHEEDMAAIGKQAEDMNQFKMEEVTRVEEVPLMDAVTKGSETTDNLTFGNLTQNVEDHKAYSLPSLPAINVEKRQIDPPNSLDVPHDVEMASKVENYELNEFYNEIVYEMEEILLDSNKSPSTQFPHNRNHQFHSNVSLPARDGTSTASTSTTTTTTSPSLLQNPYKIDSIQVIGATQKKGDVSLGERLVGVKEYTMYKLRVHSGSHQWEVERRYRDFSTLYRRLKTSFTTKGIPLPPIWSTVDQESRKYFGNISPAVVSERSNLIQDCLNSILKNPNFSSSLPSPIVWFLSPPTPNQNPVSPNLGQSISLIVEIRVRKSMRQMLEEQHYTCAGCRKHFDDGKTRLWEFVQTLGFGKPRVCEYSGQVFCSDCHVNETAVLPARVLHLWDFGEYPVSQLAKSYLDSTHDKPMLCVSAVNPFLFSKVPPLQHVINVRKRIGRMLPYVRCPFRRSIYKGIGSRRYLLESSDFFALKDLVDLSKGIFSALPVMVETISKKIVDHITDECLICYDVGVPCGARHACDDPSSLIFPFQEGEVERCKSCELVYHKPCFKKTDTCPCGVDLGTRSIRTTNDVFTPPTNNSVQDTESKFTIGFLSGLLSKATASSKLFGHKDNDTVIPMGSLPSSSH